MFRAVSTEPLRHVFKPDVLCSEEEKALISMPRGASVMRFCFHDEIRFTLHSCRSKNLCWQKCKEFSWSCLGAIFPSEKSFVVLTVTPCDDRGRRESLVRTHTGEKTVQTYITVAKSIKFGRELKISFLALLLWRGPFCDVMFRKGIGRNEEANACKKFRGKESLATVID